MNSALARNFQKYPYWVILAIEILASLMLVLHPNYSAAWVLFWALAALSLPWAFSHSFTARLTFFFFLLAFADFAKRLVFLANDQAGWSQYAVYLFPYFYYIVVLLLPWGLGLLRRGVPRAHVWIWGLIAVMLLNTWLPSATSTTAKLAATALLIMPWTMIAMASDHPESATSVWRALVVIGVLNALYAALHFLFGPTPIEVRWARAAGEFSIGASHLEASLLQRYSRVLNVWRPIGFQADAFTLALFCLNTFAMAWMLRIRKKMSSGAFYLISVFLLGGVLLSLVRTVWVAAMGMIAYAVLARRWRWLARPQVVILAMPAAFVASGLASVLLYQLRWLATVVGNPILARALTFGTLAARMGSLTAFWQSLPRFLLSGYGMAASPWITSKFGGFASLPSNFGEHNALVEYLWYLGLPGLVLFFAVLYISMRSVWRAYRNGHVSAHFMALAAAYLLALYVTGLGNGGVFLNMYFFLMLGTFLGLSSRRQMI